MSRRPFPLQLVVVGGSASGKLGADMSKVRLPMDTVFHPLHGAQSHLFTNAPSTPSSLPVLSVAAAAAAVAATTSLLAQTRRTLPSLCFSPLY